MSNYIDRDNTEFLTVDGVKTSDNIKRIFDYGYLKYKPCFSKDQRETYLEEVVIPSQIVGDLFLTFSSEDPFSLGVLDQSPYYGPSWDGTLEYSLDTETWTEWDGSTTVQSNSNNELYLRGIGNTTMVNVENWCVTDFVLNSTSGVQCTGNIETLLNYQTVANRKHPVMGICCFTSLFQHCHSLISAPQLPAKTLSEGCYGQMFSYCESLLVAPELPATTLAANCYESMFYSCTSLTIPPNLPATILAMGCYSSMFQECSGIKLSTVEEGKYTIPYRIPTMGRGVDASDALMDMFHETGGTFKGTPDINTIYYLWNN